MSKILNFFHLFTGLFSIGASLNGLKPTSISITVACANITGLDTTVIDAVIALVQSHESVASTSIEGNNIIINLNV